MDDEEGFDIYEDLEQFDTKEKCAELQAACDDLQVKYESACKEIEELKQKTQKYEVEAKTMRRNFQSLLLTARAELTRKQTQIDNLQREKDNICFRRNQRQTSQTPKTCPPRRNTPEICVDLTNKLPDENEKVKQLHDKKSSQSSNETQRMDSDLKESSTVNRRDIEQLDTNETINKVDEDKRKDSKQISDKNYYRKEGRADYPNTANESKLKKDNHDQKNSTPKETVLSEHVRIEKEAGHSHSKPSSDERRNHTFQDKVEEGRLQTSSDERRRLTFKEKVEEGKRKNRFNPFKKQLSDGSKEVIARGEKRPQTLRDIKEGCDETENKTNCCKDMKQSPKQDEWTEDRLSDRYGRSKSSSKTDWNQNENLTKFSKDREKSSTENKWLKERHVRTESESLKETAKQNWKEMRTEKDHSLKQSRSEIKKENRSTSLKTVEDDWDQMDPIVQRTVTETTPENWRQNDGKRDYSQSTKPSDVNKWEKDNLDAKRHQALLADWQSEPDNSNDAKQPLNDDKGEYERKRNRADGDQNQRVQGSSKDMKHKLMENERKQDRHVRKKHQISKESPRLDTDLGVNKMGSSHRNEKPKPTYEPKEIEGKKETTKLDSAHKEIKTDQFKGKGPPDDKFDSSARRRETHRHGRDRDADRGRTTERKDVKHSRTSQRSDSRTHSEKRDDKGRDVSETTSRRTFGNLEGEDRRSSERKHDKKERDDKTRQDRKDSSSYRKRKLEDEDEDRDRKRKKVNPRRSHSRSRTPQSKKDRREKDKDKKRDSKEVKDESESRKKSRHEKNDGYKKRDKRSSKTEKVAHKKNHETTVNFEENTKNRICSPLRSEKVEYVTSDHLNSPLEDKGKDDQLDLTELLKVQEALKSELEKESKKKTDSYSNYSGELIQKTLKCNQSADNFSLKEREDETEIKKSATEQFLAKEALVELNSIKEDAEPLAADTNVENGTTTRTETQASPSDNSEYTEYASKAKKEEVEIYAREISNPEKKEPANDVGSTPNTTALQNKNELNSKTLNASAAINEKITLDLPNLIDIGDEIKERDPFKGQTMEEPSEADEYALKESETEPVEVISSASNVADEQTSKDVNSFEKNSFTLEDIEIGMENAASLETGENDSASKPFDACESSESKNITREFCDERMHGVEPSALIGSDNQKVSVLSSTQNVIKHKETNKKFEASSQDSKMDAENFPELIEIDSESSNDSLSVNTSGDNVEGKPSIGVGDIQQQLTNIDPDECNIDSCEPTSMDNDFRPTNTEPTLDSANVSEKAQNAILQSTLKTDDLKGSESDSIQIQEENNLPESNKVLAIDMVDTETNAANVSEPVVFNNITNSEAQIKEPQEVLGEESRTCTESSSDKNELKAFKINKINQETKKNGNRVVDTTRECDRKPELESFLGENQQSDASSATVFQSNEASSLEVKNIKTQGSGMPLLDFFAERPNETQECAQRSSNQSHERECGTEPGDIVQNKAVKEKFGDLNLAAPESKAYQEDISKSEAKGKEVGARKIDTTYQDPRENEEKTEDTMIICDVAPATESRQMGNQQLGSASATGTDMERVSKINIPVVDIFKEKPYELNEPVQSSLHQRNKEDSESDLVDNASRDKFRDVESNLAALESRFGDVEAYDAIVASCKNNPKTKETGSTNQGRPKTQVEKTMMESDEKPQLESYQGGKQESEFSSAGSFNKNYAPSLKKAVSGVDISVIDISGENADEIYECVQSSSQQSNVELSKTDQVDDTPRNRSNEDKFKHVEEGLAAFESTLEDAEANSVVQDFSKNKTQAANQGVSVICNSSRMPESEDIVSEIFGENEVPTTKSSVRVETIASKSAPVTNTLLEHTFKSLEANMASLGSGVKQQNVTEVFDIADGAERSDVVEKATHIRTASKLHNPGDIIKPVEANAKEKIGESSVPNSLANKEVTLSSSEAKVNQQDDSKTQVSELLEMIFVVIRNAIETHEERKGPVKSDEIQTITTSIFENIKEPSLKMIEAIRSAPKADVNKVTKSVDAAKDSGIEATKCFETSTVNSCIGQSTNQGKHKQNYELRSRINVTDNAVADLMRLISVGVQNALTVHKRDGSHISNNNKTNPSTNLQEKNKIEQKTENITNKVIQTPNLTNPTGHGEVMICSCKEQTNTDKPRPVRSAGRRRSLTKESQKPEQPKLHYINQNMLLNPESVAMRQLLELKSNQKKYPIPQQHYPINPAFNIPQFYGSHNQQCARESTNQNKVASLPQTFHGPQNISGTAGKSLEAVLNNPSLSITGPNNGALGTSDSRGAGPKSLPWDAHLRNKIRMNEASNHFYPASGPCSVNGLEMQLAFSPYFDTLRRMSQPPNIAPHIAPPVAPPIAPPVAPPIAPSVKASKRPRANSQFEELPPPPQNMLREIGPNWVSGQYLPSTIQTMYNYQSNLMPYAGLQNLNTEPATKSNKNETKGGTTSKKKQSTNVNLEKTANVQPMERLVDPRLVNTRGKNLADFLEWGTFQNDLMAFQASKYEVMGLQASKHEITNQSTPSNNPQKKPRAPRKKKPTPLQEKIGEAEREVFVEKNFAIDLSMPTQSENLENVIDSLRTRNVHVNLQKADKSEGLEQTFSGVKTTHKVGQQSSEKETLIQSALLGKIPQETDELSIICIPSTNSSTETETETEENRSQICSRSEVDEKLKSTTNQEIEAKEPLQGKFKDTEYLSFASGLNSFSQKSRQSLGLNIKDSTHAKTEPSLQAHNYLHPEGEISHIENDLVESRRKSVGIERYLTKKHRASFHREEVDENPQTVVVDLCESSDEENEDAFLTKKRKASMQEKAADAPTSTVEMQEGEGNKQEDAAKITSGTDDHQNEKPASPQNWGSLKPRKYATPTKKEKILSMTNGTYLVQHEVPSSMKKLNFPATETVVEQTNATNSDLGLKPIEPKGNEDVNCQISVSREANLLSEIAEQRISKKEKEPTPVCKSKDVSPRAALIGVPTQNEPPNFGDDIISTADEIIHLLQNGQILEEFKKLREVNPEHQVKDRGNLKRLNAPTSTNVECELKEASIPEINSKNSEKRDEGRAINDEPKIIIIDDAMVSQDPLYTSTPLKPPTPPTKKLTNFPKEDSGLSTIVEDTMDGTEKTAMMSSIELTETVTLRSTKHLESPSLVNSKNSEKKPECPAIDDVSKVVLPQVSPITSTSLKLLSSQTKKSSNFTKQASCCDDASERTEKASIISKVETTKKSSTKVVKNVTAKEVVTGRKPKDIGPATTSSHEKESFPSTTGKKRDARKLTVDKNPLAAEATSDDIPMKEEDDFCSDKPVLLYETDTESASSDNVDVEKSLKKWVLMPEEFKGDKDKFKRSDVIVVSQSKSEENDKAKEIERKYNKIKSTFEPIEQLPVVETCSKSSMNKQPNENLKKGSSVDCGKKTVKEKKSEKKQKEYVSKSPAKEEQVIASADSTTSPKLTEKRIEDSWVHTDSSIDDPPFQNQSTKVIDAEQFKVRTSSRIKRKVNYCDFISDQFVTKRKRRASTYIQRSDVLIDESSSSSITTNAKIAKRRSSLNLTCESALLLNSTDKKSTKSEINLEKSKSKQSVQKSEKGKETCIDKTQKKLGQNISHVLNLEEHAIFDVFPESIEKSVEKDPRKEKNKNSICHLESKKTKFEQLFGKSPTPKDSRFEDTSLSSTQEWIDSQSNIGVKVDSTVNCPVSPSNEPKNEATNISQNKENELKNSGQLNMSPEKVNISNSASNYTIEAVNENVTNVYITRKKVKKKKVRSS